MTTAPELLEEIKTIAADVAHRDARRLGIFVRDLHDFAAPFFIELGNAQPQHLAFGRRSETEIGRGDCLFDRMHHRFVPDLHGNEPWFGHAHGSELVERHVCAISFDLYRFEQARRCPASTQAAQLLLQQLDCTLHAAPELVDVVRRVCHGVPRTRWSILTDFCRARRWPALNCRRRWCAPLRAAPPRSLPFRGSRTR